jgi:hypothetical protein
MKRSVFWALVRKDLYLQRGFMIAMLVVSVPSWFAMSLGGKVMAVGGLLFLTANVAGAIFITVFTLLTERKEQARLFALSLPISGARYELAKVTGGYLAFTMPWLVLTIMVSLGFLLADDAERGMLVYALLIQCFILAMFSVVMAALFAVTTEAMSGVVILGVNVCFSMFMMYIHQPEITQPWHGDALVWTPFARSMFAGEFIAIVVSLAIMLVVISRRRDHV